MVVNNAEAMKRLETIVHPMLRSHQLKFLSDAEASGAPVAGYSMCLCCMKPAVKPAWTRSWW